MSNQEQKRNDDDNGNIQNVQAAQIIVQIMTDNDNDDNNEVSPIQRSPPAIRHYNWTNEEPNINNRWENNEM